MTAIPIARPEHELTGAEVRRVTRRATAARSETTLWTQLGDMVGTLTSITVGIAVAGGSLPSLRAHIAVFRQVDPGATLLGPSAAMVAAVLCLTGLLVVLDRLGPVSSTPPVASWWLPLPADR